MSERPWPTPARYTEARWIYPALTVAINVEDEWVEGDLLLWLRHTDLGWYGYCHWWRGRSIYTEPIPADRLRVVRNRRINVYDDGTWRHGTLHGWRRHSGQDWEAAVKLTGWPTPEWVPGNRVQPA